MPFTKPLQLVCGNFFDSGIVSINSLHNAFKHALPSSSTLQYLIAAVNASNLNEVKLCIVRVTKLYSLINCYIVFQVFKVFKAIECWYLSMPSTAITPHIRRRRGKADCELQYTVTYMSL